MYEDDECIMSLGSGKERMTIDICKMLAESMLSEHMPSNEALRPCPTPLRKKYDDS